MSFDIFGSALWVSNWLTPLWLIGIGALLGLIIVCILAGVAWLLRGVPMFSRLGEIRQTVTEGPLQPIFAITIALAIFGIVGTAVVRRPAEMVDSLFRWSSLGTATETFQINAPPEDDPTKVQVIAVDFRRNELLELRFTTTEPLSVSAFAPDDPG